MALFRKFFRLLAGSVSIMVCATAANAVELSDPKAIYQKFCSVCHGDQGNADTRAAGSLSPRPRDFTSPQAQQELTRERMIKSVTEGRPGTAMVGHARKLNPKQIEGVVDYIRSSFMRTAPAATVATVAPAAKAASRGEQVYKRNCSSCHGDAGNVSLWARNGLNPPPRDFTSPAARAELTRERMLQSVTQGRPGTAMQPFGKRLSKEEIEAVVAYVRTEFMKVDTPVVADAGAPAHRGPAALPPAHPTVSAPVTTPVEAKADMSLPFANKLKGNATRGQQFYMNNCFTCHGINGDGNGPRAYFITPRPRNFTSEQARNTYNRPRLYDAIEKGKRGTPMPAWGSVLSPQELADVSEFVFQGYIKASFPVKVPAGTRADEKKKAS